MSLNQLFDSFLLSWTTLPISQKANLKPRPTEPLKKGETVVKALWKHCESIESLQVLLQVASSEILWRLKGIPFLCQSLQWTKDRTKGSNQPSCPYWTFVFHSCSEINGKNVVVIVIVVVMTTTQTSWDSAVNCWGKGVFPSMTGLYFESTKIPRTGAFGLDRGSTPPLINSVVCCIPVYHAVSSCSALIPQLEATKLLRSRMRMPRMSTSQGNSDHLQLPSEDCTTKACQRIAPCILKSKAATGIYRVLWAGVKALEMRIWPSSLSWELGQDTPGRGRGGTWQLKRILHRKAQVSPEINRNLCKKCCQIQVEGCYLWLSLLSICSIHFTLSLCVGLKIWSNQMKAWRRVQLNLSMPRPKRTLVLLR